MNYPPWYADEDDEAWADEEFERARWLSGERRESWPDEPLEMEDEDENVNE